VKLAYSITFTFVVVDQMPAKILLYDSCFFSKHFRRGSEPEAPLVQVTGSFGTWVDRLKLQGENLRSLSIAGMAAGFTALLALPWGNFCFRNSASSIRFRVLRRSAIVSSCASYVVSCNHYQTRYWTHLGFSAVQVGQY